jgi:hypothetical protein
MRNLAVTLVLITSPPAVPIISGRECIDALLKLAREKGSHVRLVCSGRNLLRLLCTIHWTPHPARDYSHGGYHRRRVH